jgi:hypothetical protein
LGMILGMILKIPLALKNFDHYIRMKNTRIKSI